MKELTHLELNNNLLTDEGVKEIANNIKQLTHLNLYNNCIGDEGAIAICNNKK